MLKLQELRMKLRFQELKEYVHEAGKVSSFTTVLLFKQSYMESLEDRRSLIKEQDTSYKHGLAIDKAKVGGTLSITITTSFKHLIG